MTPWGPFIPRRSPHLERILIPEASKRPLWPRETWREGGGRGSRRGWAVGGSGEGAGSVGPGVAVGTRGEGA